MERIDATKLADFQKCPKNFDYRHNHGYRLKGDKIDLLFGSILGEAFEIFEKLLLTGEAHEIAHGAALLHVLNSARNEDGSNRFGSFVDSWRCTGTAPYKNDKGNPAKCPYSHKGKYFPAPAPEICSCGSEAEVHQLWVPIKNGKDIDRLVELLVGYTDRAHTRQLIPQKLGDKPLIELYWETNLNHPILVNPVILCGNIDAVKAFGAGTFIVDYKTTGRPINETYWSQFTPNIQIDLYNMAADKVLPDLNIKGVAIEAFSTSGEPGFRLFRATDTQKVEMFEDTAYWIKSLQECRQSGIWPRNRASCFMCPFQQVCSRPPEARQAILDNKYERGLWNPQTRQVEPIQDVGSNLPSMPTSAATATSSPQPLSGLSEPDAPQATKISSSSTTAN